MLRTVPPISDNLLLERGFGDNKSPKSLGSAVPPAPENVFVTGSGTDAGAGVAAPVVSAAVGAAFSVVAGAGAGLAAAGAALLLGDVIAGADGVGTRASPAEAVAGTVGVAAVLFCVPTVCVVDWSICVPGAGVGDVPDGCWADAAAAKSMAEKH
jgi:hypothetical protein